MTGIDYLAEAKKVSANAYGPTDVASAFALIAIAEELRKFNDRAEQSAPTMRWWDVSATYPNGIALTFRVRATSEQGAVDQVMERATVDPEATFTAVVAR